MIRLLRNMCVNNCFTFQERKWQYLLQNFQQILCMATGYITTGKWQQPCPHTNLITNQKGSFLKNFEFGA